MEDIKISAMKISAKIPDTDLREVEKFCNKFNISCKWFNRHHLVVYHQLFTYTFFKRCETGRLSWHDQHVNITRVEPQNVEESIEELAWLIDNKSDKIFHSIDNITASGRLCEKLDLIEFIKCNTHYQDFIDYNPERFTGLFVRGQYGKAILFSNGKVVYIGCKDKTQLEKLHKLILELCAAI